MATYAPRHVDIWPWTKWRASAGSISRVNQATGLGMGYVGPPSSGAAAINDSVTYDVALDAGTWTVTVIHFKVNSGGIADVILDGSSIGTINMYQVSATATWNVVTQFTGVTVATPGVYDLELIASSKDPSSSNYLCRYHLITLTRTGA